MVRTTSTCGLPAGTVDGAKVQLDSAGNPEQANVMGAPVAGLGISIMCSVADCPAVTVTEGRVGAMVKSGLATAKDCGTLAAALKLASPTCEAVMVQEPAPVRWTVEPVTLQTPLAPKVTDRAEDAVPLTLKSGAPKILLARAPNVMVWLALAMEKVCGTSAAGLKLASPACEAVMVQGPAPVRWIVAPLTLELPVAPKVTARAEDAVALTLKSGLPKVLPASPTNVMVWPALAMVKVCGTSAAWL